MKNKINVLLIVAVALTMAGCGGSSGGSGSSSAVKSDVNGGSLAGRLTPTPNEPPLTYITTAPTEPATGETMVTFNDGVILNIDDNDNTFAVTGDDGMPRFVEISDEVDTNRKNENSAQIARVFAPFIGSTSEEGADVEYFSKTAPNGHRVVVFDFYNDYLSNNGEERYVDFGVWLEIGDNRVVDDLFYVHGDDPFTVANIAGLSGSATYEGGATAVYADSDNTIDFFGKVSLTANFDNDMIGGTITEIQEGYGRENDNSEINSSTLNLLPADFSTGVWSGDTTLQAGTNFAGKWGGQFFGNNGAGTGAANQPQYAVGIFNGVATGANAGDSSFVGGYVAEKQ